MLFFTFAQPLTVTPVLSPPVTDCFGVPPTIRGRVRTETQACDSQFQRHFPGSWPCPVGCSNPLPEDVPGFLPTGPWEQEEQPQPRSLLPSFSSPLAPFPPWRGQDGCEAQPGGVGLQCKHHHVNIYLCLEPGLPASHALPIQVHVACSEALVTESQAKGTNVASRPSPATNFMCGSEQELPGPSFSHL